MVYYVPPDYNFILSRHQATSEDKMMVTSLPRAALEVTELIYQCLSYDLQITRLATGSLPFNIRESSLVSLLSQPRLYTATTARPRIYVADQQE